MSTEPNKQAEVSGLSDQGPGLAGDLLVIAAHELGGHELLVEIVDVLGEGEHTHYRVRWEDDHESIFFPGPDATIRRARMHRQP